MTDKEIIIDGVNVAGCKYFNRFRSICHNKNLCCDCEKNQDCYFKQLKRKEQECKELKKYIKEDLAPHAQVLQKENDNLKEKFKKFFGIDNQECWDIAFLKDENARYHKALDEIEEYIYTDCEYNDGCDRNICIRCKYSNVHDKEILDIVNKAKGKKSR